MKIKIFFLILILTLVGLCSLLFLWAPYHFYHIAVTDGIRSEYLNLGKLPDTYYLGDEETLGKTTVISEGHEEQKLWNIFHFSDFLIPLPLHHPEVNFYPLIDDSEGKPLIGGRFVDNAQNEVFSFVLLGGKPFTIKADKEKLFSLPAVKQIIFSRPVNEIWADIFRKKIEHGTGKIGMVDYFRQGGELSIKEMIYNLFLLNMRPLLFRQYQLEKIKYLPKNNLGIITVHDLDERYTTEHLFVFSNGLIYKIKIRTKKSDFLGKNTRDLFLNYLVFEESSVDSSQKIYAQFRNLPFRVRLEQEGMIYLYAAWSHVTEKVEFLREMIQMLERGPEKFRYLKPLYEFAYRKFGDLLSKEKDEEQKLKEKMQHELEKEIESVKRNNLKDTEGEHLKGSERETYLIQKAKESQKNSDLEEKSLDR